MRIADQLNSRERTALIICLAFIVATMLLAVVDQTSLVHTARTMMDPNYLRLRYTGTIVIPDQPQGMCRFVQYDNKTSEFRDTEIAECLGKAGVNSPYNRFDALRDTFTRK